MIQFNNGLKIDIPRKAISSRFNRMLRTIQEILNSNGIGQKGNTARAGWPLEKFLKRILNRHDSIQMSISGNWIYSSGTGSVITH